MKAPGQEKETITMPPVRVYLDTSDYGSMYCASPGSSLGAIRQYLLEQVRKGHIEIGMSYHVVFELLQKAEPQYKADRLARAQLLGDLCGQNAFAFYGDLARFPVFSTEGNWYPSTACDALEIEVLVKDIMRLWANEPGLNRHQRRLRNNRVHFVDWVRRNPHRLRLFPGQKSPLPFARQFIESGACRRYILGDLSRIEANRLLQTHLRDPVSFYQMWHEHYDYGNKLAETGKKLSHVLMSFIDSAQAAWDEVSALQSDAKQQLRAKDDPTLSAEARDLLAGSVNDAQLLKAQINSAQELRTAKSGIEEYIGAPSALVIAQILIAFRREKRRIKPNDAMDYTHAMYLPHTDLWRGDKAFSDLLIKHKVHFSDRVVPTLVQLPERIEFVKKQRTAAEN